MISLSNTYQHDDPKTWEEIKANGDAAIVGVGHCSNCAPAVATHAITLETKYGVPTVALHTDKFDRVVQSVTKMAGPAGRAARLRAAAGDGQDRRRAARLRLRQGPDHRQAGHAGGHRRAHHRAERGKHVGGRNDVRAVDAAAASSPTPKTICNSYSSTTTGPTRCRSCCRPRSASRRCWRTPAASPTRSSAACSRPQFRVAWEYTVEKVAVNAVMAGAKPEYFPVILALAASGRLGARLDLELVRRRWSWSTGRSARRSA